MQVVFGPLEDFLVLASSAWLPLVSDEDGYNIQWFNNGNHVPCDRIRIGAVISTGGINIWILLHG